MYNISAQTVFRLYEETPNQVIEFAKETNNKTSKMAETHKRIYGTGYAAQINFNITTQGEAICGLDFGLRLLAWLIFISNNKL